MILYTFSSSIAIGNPVTGNHDNGRILGVCSEHTSPWDSQGLSMAVLDLNPSFLVNDICRAVLSLHVLVFYLVLTRANCHCVKVNRGNVNRINILFSRMYC